MVKFTKTKKVNASAEKVWEVFAHGFDDAHKWMASVPHSYSQTNGESFDGAQSDGRVCELSSNPDGMKASEQFLAYNEEQRTATVKIDFVDTAFFFPVKFNTLNFSLVEIDNNHSSMTWQFRSKIKPLGYLIWPFIRLGFGTFVGQIMEELKFYVENGTPHPRKLKAMEKAQSKGS